jgi:hypothetical protein
MGRTAAAGIGLSRRVSGVCEVAMGKAHQGWGIRELIETISAVSVSSPVGM